MRNNEPVPPLMHKPVGFILYKKNIFYQEKNCETMKNIGKMLPLRFAKQKEVQTVLRTKDSYKTKLLVILSTKIQGVSKS